jgi:hypothetical protein
VLGTLYTNGSVQVAYKWWIVRKGLLTTLPNDDGSDSDTAPVEDDGTPGAKM